MKFFLLLTLLLSSCQDYNSNSGDQGRYGIVSLVGSAEFKASYAVIQNRCVNCHSGYHNNWANFTAEQDLVNDNKVVPANPAGSLLIQRIVNTGGSAANMPPGGSPLPDAEYEALKTWITAIPVTP